MGYTFLLFLIPLVAWILIAKIVFKHEFSIGEMAAQFGITGVLILLLTSAGYLSAVSDTKIVNGSVTGTVAQRETCDQYWSDWPDGFCTNQDTRTVRDGETCTRNSNGVRTCTPKYKTQYRSIYPWEIRYFVQTNIERTYEIKRVDAQGSLMPPRYSEVRVGDPVSDMVTYVNYIKGASDTLFNQKLEDVPPIAYPKLYDYYKVRRVIYYGVASNFDYVQEWNDSLSEVNRDISKTGANVIVNVVGESQLWAEGLAQAWDAHNINDVVVSIGVTNDKITWVDVRSWTSNKMSDITIRDEILDLGVVDKDKINDILKKNILTYYQMKPMEDFEYLADDIPPPTWLYVVMGILLLIVTPLVSFFLSREDPIYKIHQRNYYYPRRK